MGEMQQALGMLKRLPLVLERYRHGVAAGRWGFVGSVPIELAWEGDTDLIEIGRTMGFGLVCRVYDSYGNAKPAQRKDGRYVTKVTFATKDDALMAATRLGVAPTQIMD